MSDHYDAHGLPIACDAAEAQVRSLRVYVAEVIGERDQARAELAEARAALAGAEKATADARRAYELKVADFAQETKRVEILARVLLDDNHNPDGFHAEGDRCRQCKALREALRPEEGADRG